MKTLLTAIAVLVASNVACATPQLVWDLVDYDYPWETWTVSVSDDQHASWAVSIDFYTCWATIRQELAFGAVDVNTEADADLYAMVDPNFDKDLDSWVFDEWSELPTGISGPPDEPFHIHAGTAPGADYGVLPLAQLVVRGSLWDVGWSGLITRQGVSYYTEYNCPEPATGLLSAIGVTALTRHRRRARLRRCV